MNKNGVHKFVEPTRLEIATIMLEGAAKLDTTEEEKNILVDNALYMADRLIQKESREGTQC